MNPGCSRAALHGRGDEGVEVRPDGANVRGERRAEHFVEHVEEGAADGGVMLFAHAVADVARAELFEFNGERGGAVEHAQSETEHIHELAGLIFNIVAEQGAKRRIELEQPAVKDQGRDVDVAFHGGEGLSQQQDLIRSHGGIYTRKRRGEHSDFGRMALGGQNR